MKIKIGAKEYSFKYNLRALIVFERIADKPFEIKGITDWSLLAYSCFVSANPDSTIGYSEFIESVSPSELNKVIDQLSQAMKVDDQFAEEAKGVKKK